MIIDITLPIKVKIDVSKIQSLHDSLVAIRDASSGNLDELNAIIQPLSDKLQYLQDRKLLIQDARDAEEERLRLIRSQTTSSGTS